MSLISAMFPQQATGPAATSQPLSQSTNPFGYGAVNQVGTSHTRIGRRTASSSCKPYNAASLCRRRRPTRSTRPGTRRPRTATRTTWWARPRASSRRPPTPTCTALSRTGRTERTRSLVVSIFVRFVGAMAPSPSWWPAVLGTATRLWEKAAVPRPVFLHQVLRYQIIVCLSL